MIFTYRGRLILLCLLLCLFLIAALLYGHHTTRQVITEQNYRNISEKLELLKVQLKTDTMDLKHLSRMVVKEQQLQEYLFVITEFDSGRQAFAAQFMKQFGWLPVSHHAVITKTGELIVGDHQHLLPYIDSGSKQTQSFYLSHDDSMEFVVIEPVIYRDQLIGKLILTRMYDKSWLQNQSRLMPGIYVIERGNDVIVVTPKAATTLQELLAMKDHQWFPIALSAKSEDGVRLWVGISARQYLALLQDYRTASLINVVIGIGVLILFAWLLNRNFDRPLRQLSHLTRQISQGVYPDIGKHTAKTEVELLRNQFADMVMSLRDKEVEIQKVQKSLELTAVTDPLTGIYNRRAFEEKLQELIESCRSNHHTHAMCYIDLDQFKAVNDSCGHRAGDQLLVQLTAMLRTRIRQSDFFARLGGDEFGLILLDVDLERAGPVVEEIRLIIGNFKFVWDGKIHRVGASIGLTLIDNRIQTIQEILCKSDIACYAAKNEGRNCVKVFNDSDSLEFSSKEVVDWSAEIIDAFEENRWLLHFQPIYDNTREQNVYLEALLRLKRKSGAITRPGAFLSVAERHELTPRIDRWVIETVMGMLKRHLPPWCERIFVNLSGLTLSDPTLAEHLHDCAARNNFNPRLLCFEINELNVLRHMDRIRHNVQQIRAMGCALALDNFGAGFSHYGHFDPFGAEFIKIDRGYVENALNQHSDRALLEAMQNLAVATDKKTVAMGIDYEKLQNMVINLHMHYSQGYLFGKPQALIEPERQVVV